jgi:hypothetical protein
MAGGGVVTCTDTPVPGALAVRVCSTLSPAVIGRPCRRRSHRDLDSLPSVSQPLEGTTSQLLGRIEALKRSIKRKLAKPAIMFRCRPTTDQDSGNSAEG